MYIYMALAQKKNLELTETIYVGADRPSDVMEESRNHREIHRMS